QMVTIFAGAIALNLDVWAQVRSTDTTSQNDYAWIDMYTDPNADPSSFLFLFNSTWYNDDKGTVWTHTTEQSSDVSSYQGQKLAFAIHASNLDGTTANDPSNFLFDSVSLTATICQ